MARKPISKRTRAKRIQQYREARAIIAVAAAMTWKTPDRKHPKAPNYYKIADMLGLPKKAADVADEIWNDANGPDEGQQTEENALERAADLLGMELDA